MSDVWTEAAASPPSEAPVFEDLPDKAWFIGTTATKENGGAAPELRERNRKDGGTWQQFNIGLICRGGDSALNEETHKNKMVFFSTGIDPSPQAQNPGLLSGKFTGFLNSCFAKGIDSKDAEERKRLRWGSTLKVLKSVADMHPELYDPNKYPSKAVFLAACAVGALRAESYTVLAKTARRTWDRGGQKGSALEVGSIEDDTQENRTNRGCKLFGAEGSASTF